MRLVVEMELEDLELLAEAAEAEASRCRVAAELASAEVARARAAKEDVRTRSVRIVEVLGQAGRLVASAAAVRAAVPLAATSEAPVVRLDVFGVPEAAEGHTAPPPDADTLRAALATLKAAPATASAAPEPVAPLDEAALADLDPGQVTAARLAHAGRAALGPDADRAPSPEEATSLDALVATAETEGEVSA
jgi:hypothetical protein